MEKLLTNLSNEGRKSVEDNGVTFEMLQEFTDNDIVDVFKTFADRFLVRKFLKSMQPSINTETKTKAKAASIEDYEIAGTSTQSLTSNTESADDAEVEETVKLSEPKTKSQPVPYSVDEMLDKSSLRGKPTKAQIYFRNLLRDAAISAKIWKSAPTLSEISESKRNTFFKAIEVVSCLGNRKKDVWKRLGESLQNRRKYIHDKGKGKRLSKARSSDSELGKKSPHDSELGKKSQQIDLELGSQVILFSKDKTAVGEGIVIKKGLMFSEVVVQKAYEICKQIEVELPNAVGDQLTFTENIVKKVIEWKNVRMTLKSEMKKSVPKKASVVTTSKQKSSVGKTEIVKSSEVKSSDSVLKTSAVKTHEQKKRAVNVVKSSAEEKSSDSGLKTSAVKTHEQKKKAVNVVKSSADVKSSDSGLKTSAVSMST